MKFVKNCKYPLKLKCNYNMASNIKCIQRNLLALPPMKVFIISSSPNPSAKRVHSMTQKVILTAWQKQTRKCNEIVILSQVSPPNWSDILEQAWSSNELVLHVEIQSQLSKKYFSRSLLLHKNKRKIIFREALPW